MFKITIVGLLASILAVHSASACQVGWRSSADLEKEAEVVVVAQIVSARHLSSSFRADDYEYKISIERTERGDMQLGSNTVTYEDLKAHLRGQTMVCPLKNGSGIEHDLKPQKRYRLYLKSSSNREILLARPEKD